MSGCSYESRHFFANNKRCRDTAKHRCLGFEVGGDEVDQQPLVNVLLVVDAVGLHHSLQVRLEHPGHFDLKLPNAEFGVLRC